MNTSVNKANTTNNVLLFTIVITFWGFSTISNSFFLILDQIIFLVSSFLFLLLSKHHNYLYDIKKNKWILFYLGIYVLVALISCYFSLVPLQSLRDWFAYLVRPIVFFVIFYLIGTKLSEKQSQNFFLGLIAVFAIHVFATLLDFSSWRSTGFDSVPIVPYAFFLTSALSTFIFISNSTLRYAFAALTLMALYFNGNRTSIFALICFLFFLIIFYANKKIKIISILFLAISTPILFQTTQLLEERYNFKKMLDNIEEVWSTSPAKMGQFDKYCYDQSYFWQFYLPEKTNHLIHSFKNTPKVYDVLIEKNLIMQTQTQLRIYNNLFYVMQYPNCRYLSSTPNIFFEYSILTRLSLYKSMIEIVKQNPFLPNGYSPYLYSINTQYYSMTDNIPYIDPIPYPHNGYLSAFFEMGILGGLLYCFLPIIFILNIIKKQSKKITLFYTLFTTSLMVQNLTEASFSFFAIFSTWLAITGTLLSIPPPKKS